MHEFHVWRPLDLPMHACMPYGAAHEARTESETFHGPMIRLLIRGSYISWLASQVITSCDLSRSGTTHRWSWACHSIATSSVYSVPRAVQAPQHMYTGTQSKPAAGSATQVTRGSKFSLRTRPLQLLLYSFVATLLVEHIQPSERLHPGRISTSVDEAGYLPGTPRPKPTGRHLGCHFDTVARQPC